MQAKSLKDGLVGSSVWEMIVGAQGNWGSLWADKRADAKRIVIAAWWLMAEGRMDVEVLQLCAWCDCHSSSSQERCPGNGNKLCAVDLQRKMVVEGQESKMLTALDLEL